jgi:hypothetical protein
MTTSTLRDSTAHRLSRPEWTRLAGPLAVLLALLLTAGCGEQEKKAAPKVHQFEINVSVSDENDSPVAEAPVLLDGKTVGFTDRDGLFEAVINEQAGAQVEVSIGKMDEYLVPEDAVAGGTLKLSKSLDGKKKPVPITLQTSVRSARKDYLVWLDTNCGKYLGSEKCQNIPVKHNDQVVAHTDEEGQAHFSFQGVPGDKVTVSLETPTYKPSADDDEDAAFVMKPETPSYDIELGLDSEVLRITEEFSDPVAAAKAKKKAKRRRSYRRAKRRKAAKKAKKKEAKKKKDDGVIDLW